MPETPLDLTKVEMYCLMDKEPIPLERILKRSSTCSPKCQKKLRKIRLAIINSRKCLHCFKPSTPENRALFRQFKSWLTQNGHSSVPRRGRRRKKGVEGIPA